MRRQRLIGTTLYNKFLKLASCSVSMPLHSCVFQIDLEDETSRRIKNTLGDFTQVLVNDPKNLIGISRSTPVPSNGGPPVNGYMVAGHLTTGHPGHLMTTGYGYSSHAGYASAGYSSSLGIGSYGRNPAALKKPPPFAAKPSMPNCPKGPDKQKIPLQSYTANKASHPSGTYQVQDSSTWDVKDQRRLPNNASVDNGLSTSAPIWNCVPDTPAIQISPFHLPPSVLCQDAPAKQAQIPAAANIEFATPAKRNSGRPSNLKIIPDKVSHLLFQFYFDITVAFVLCLWHTTILMGSLHQ